MFMFMLFTSTLLAVKKNGPSSTKKRLLSADALTPPQLRTIEEWQALSRETLTLSANAVNIPSTTDSIQQQIASTVADAAGPLYSLLANRMNGSIPPPQTRLILPN